MTALPARVVSLLPTATLFAGGAIITSYFSASLYVLTRGVTFSHVLLIGMIIPSLTWLVHLSASWLLLSADARLRYWRILGIVCLIGSIDLLPAAVANTVFANPPGWLSAVNVVLSVLVMAAVLFRLSAVHGFRWLWPITWSMTIAANMALFVWVSASWWR